MRSGRRRLSGDQLGHGGGDLSDIVGFADDRGCKADRGGAGGAVPRGEHERNVTPAQSFGDGGHRTTVEVGVENGGINLFVAGTIQQVGKICWSIDEVLEQLLIWKKELDDAR